MECLVVHLPFRLKNECFILKVNKMVVVKMVDEAVAEKVDTTYIAEKLAHIHNVSIVFVCTEEGGAEDDWIDSEGMRHLVLQLPYALVRVLPDARSLMLERVYGVLGLN
jgi:hypothetical protein